MTETAAQIAARYGATLPQGVTVTRVPAGVSGLPELVWTDKGLMYAEKQKPTTGYFVGAPRKPITVDGRTWPSRTALAQSLGVSGAAVAKAIAKGKLVAMVRRRLAA